MIGRQLNIGEPERHLDFSFNAFNSIAAASRFHAGIQNLGSLSCLLECFLP
jgi:hypothetical protein